MREHQLTTIDAHVHFVGLDLHDKMLQDLRTTDTDQFAIVVPDRDRDDPDHFKQAHALWFKHQHPDRVFVFGGLDFTGTYDHGRAEPDVPLLDQLKRLMALGCDGVKSLSGKPSARKNIGQPLDGPVFEPMLIHLEETGYPVLWHVSDPPEFWDAEAVPLWARQRGWWYDDTHPRQAQIDREFQAVMDRHPRLNLILPHFFFLSDQLERAARLLDDHPTFCLDLTPGVEMYHNFTKNPEATREFFLQYADQILFGSDRGMMNHTTGLQRGWMIRHFLETDDQYDVPDDPVMTPDARPALKGIALPEPVLEKIYRDNFRRVMGRDCPRPLETAELVCLLQELAERSRQRGEEPNTAATVLDQIVEPTQ